MELFLNEKSLNEQYFSQEDFYTAIRRINVLIELINEKSSMNLYKDNFILIADFKAIKNELFQTSLSKINNKQVRVGFIRLLNDKKIILDWRTTKIHSDDDIYICEELNEIVNNTTLAEITERQIKFNDNNYLLLNFSNSIFEKHIKIIKNDKISENLRCIENIEEFENWLKLETNYYNDNYDFNSNFPPIEEQTILIKNTNRFKFIGKYFIKDRMKSKIFYDNKYNRLLYLDTFHIGINAQLEVFDLSGENHLGEADINTGEFKDDAKIKKYKISKFLK